MMSHQEVVTGSERAMLRAIRGVEEVRAKAITRHIAWFVLQRSAGDLLNLGVFPNAKEITESVGVFRAALKHAGGLRLSDPSIACVCVGDGATPRTGALVAFNTAWQVHSVDPALNPAKMWNARRLTTHACPIEHMEFTTQHTIVVLAVHSHARLDAAVAVMHAPRVAVVAMPCCLEQALSVPPDIEFADEGVWSPERTIRVWRDAPRVKIAAAIRSRKRMSQ